MITTINLGLVVWNSVTDPYSHDELAENWAKVDLHDHTQGKGVRITTAAIEDGAITAPKIAANAIPEYTIDDGSITAQKLATSSVTTAKVQDGAITEIKLGPGITFPVGVISPYGGSASPSGWLLCDGSNINRSTYSALFAVLGTSYGAGDGATTFTLPDLRGRIPVGVGTHADVSVRGAKENPNVAVASRTPNHEHGLNAHHHDHVSQIIYNPSGTPNVRIATPDSTAFLDQNDSEYEIKAGDTGISASPRRTDAINATVTTTESMNRHTIRSSGPVDGSGVTVNNTADETAPFQTVNYIIKHGA